MIKADMVKPGSAVVAAGVSLKEKLLSDVADEVHQLLDGYHQESGE